MQSCNDRIAYVVAGNLWVPGSRISNKLYVVYPILSQGYNNIEYWLTLGGRKVVLIELDS